MKQIAFNAIRSLRRRGSRSFLGHIWRRLRPTVVWVCQSVGLDKINWSRTPSPRPPRKKIYPGRRRVFIECTHTYHSDLNTGIQRVVRNIIKYAPEAALPYGYDVVPVIFHGGEYLQADSTQILNEKTSPPPRLFCWIGKKIQWFVRREEEECPSGPYVVEASLDEYRSHKNHILILLDASWNDSIWKATNRFKKDGGQVIGVIYDLIPITHSYTSVPILTRKFTRWIQHHIKLSDGFVGISRSTADSLSQFIKSQKGVRSQIRSRMRTPISYFHLGSELDFVKSGATPPRTRIQSIFSPDRHVFLMVGSIEPRKNHQFVLAAMDQFWRQGGVGTLLILGKQAWKSDALLEKIMKHSRYKKDLFLIRDATDDDLEYCYKKSSGLIIASEIEGFGLPVVEAYQRGLPVLCSDIPVFREIAGSYATFFGIDDAANLVGALNTFCLEHSTSAKERREPHDWLTWKQSAAWLMKEVFMICGQSEIQVRNEASL